VEEHRSVGAGGWRPTVQHSENTVSIHLNSALEDGGLQYLLLCFQHLNQNAGWDRLSTWTLQQRRCPKQWNVNCSRKCLRPRYKFYYAVH